MVKEVLEENALSEAETEEEFDDEVFDGLSSMEDN